MIKTFFKLMLCVIVYTIVWAAASAILPFSQGFNELKTSENPLDPLFLFINSAWICCTIFFIIRNTHWSGKRLFLYIVFVMFFVQSFMTQIETLFFGEAFPVLTRLDIILIMYTGVFPLLATVPLLVKFFQNKDVEIEKTEIDIKSTLTKLGIIGVIYLCVYMIFGYFVAWQFEELRIFYSGSSEKLSFFAGQAINFKTNPIIFPFQILRGIFFGALVMPLKNMISKKSVFIASVCLVYLSTAVMLSIPNVLFPDTVRIAHLIEMTSSMLVFGLIVGNILWSKQENDQHTSL